MATNNGDLSWGFQPVGFLTGASQNLAGAFPDDRANYLVSANTASRYQVQWFSGGITEAQEPSAGNAVTNPSTGATTFGDVVNVIFTIQAQTNVSNGGTYQTIAVIKKSRDIANRRYINDEAPKGHRFTIDISQLIADQLNYSLCPINKGTWQSNEWGGMNGGLVMQDNVLSGNSAMGTPISQFNVSRNGSFRNVRVFYNAEIINADGELETLNLSRTSQTVSYINSVDQFELDPVFYSYSKRRYLFDGINQSSSVQHNFLTRCPNTGYNHGQTPALIKPIQIKDQAEFVQFFMRRSTLDGLNTSADPDEEFACSGLAIKIECFDYGNSGSTPTDEFYLIDLNKNAATRTVSTTEVLAEYLNQNFIQNISPYFINNTAATKKHTATRTTFPYWDDYTGNKITDNTEYYTVALYRQRAFPSGSKLEPLRASNYNFFKINREADNEPYGDVRFHWINSMGGTDSYTAKRDVVEGLSISRDVVARKSSDRRWMQADRLTNGGSLIPDADYISDTMRGGDIYKGGREVSNVNAEKNNSVYTEPLNKSTAKWLQEMMLSPNVWIERQSEATEYMNTVNAYLKPSDKEYIPVIITNSDVETVNQEQGLVVFNIEYTLAHKVITQRN